MDFFFLIRVLASGETQCSNPGGFFFHFVFRENSRQQKSRNFAKQEMTSPNLEM